MDLFLFNLIVYVLICASFCLSHFLMSVFGDSSVRFIVKSEVSSSVFSKYGSQVDQLVIRPLYWSWFGDLCRISLFAGVSVFCFFWIVVFAWLHPAAQREKLALLGFEMSDYSIGQRKWNFWPFAYSLILRIFFHFLALFYLSANSCWGSRVPLARYAV